MKKKQKKKKKKKSEVKINSKNGSLTCVPTKWPDVPGSGPGPERFRKTKMYAYRYSSDTKETY